MKRKGGKDMKRISALRIGAACLAAALALAPRTAAADGATATFRIWTAPPGSARLIGPAALGAELEAALATMPPIVADDATATAEGPGVPAYELPADAQGIAAWSPAPDRFGRWTLARDGETALFDILEPPWVSNVVARQRWPWNGLVDIDYEVGGYTAGLEALIEVVDAEGGRSWQETNFLAGAEPSVEVGFHRATWDTTAAGLADVVASNVVATVRLVSSERDARSSSEEFLLDTRRGPFASDGSETLAYSVLWHGDTNATVTIAQDGEALADATRLGDEGDYDWSVRFDGTYTLTHATSGSDAVETAIFVVTGLTKHFADGDIELTDYSGTYDGAAHTIGVRTNGAIEGLVLRYCGIAASEAQSLTTNHLPLTTDIPKFTNVCDMVVYVEASARGYFTETNSATVKISPLDLAGATISAIATQYYDGRPLTPAFSVQIGGLRPAAGVDYTVSYANNDRPGTATVTVTGKGNYTGRKQATFKILPARQTFTVKAGKWGRVRVETGGSTQTVGPNATKAILVQYGQAVKAAAVPDAGFAAAGASSVSYASFTKDASASFAFVPKLQGATIRWKFSAAVGRYFAQVSIPSYAGYNEALGGLSFIFADRKDAAGTLFAQLWDASKRAPYGGLVTDGGVAYRGVGLGASAFAGKGGGARVVFGVSNATLAKGDKSVPVGERKIGLYVRNRVNPSRGNESAADVGSFTGCLTWTTAGKRYYLPIVQGAANGPVSTTASAARPTVPSYVVIFNANGGKGTMASQAVSRGAKAQLKACAYTRDGCTFAGWAKSAALAKKGTVAYKNKAAVKNLAAAGKSVTVYAVWKKK